MTETERDPKAEMGMIGLGVMGRNLMLNMADHGFTVAGYDKDPEKVESMRKESGEKNIFPTIEKSKFIRILKRPRMILLLVPAGGAVDEVIGELIPELDPGDLIIDAGNSFFRDTDRRTQMLEKKGILYMGVGVSGGEEGARKGPSIMPGGSPEAFKRVEPVFEAIAAKVKGEPCMAYMGSGSSGHFVKMVHNGIEYAIMQLISEAYELLKKGLALNNQDIRNVFALWNTGKLNGFLIEITGLIFSRKDEDGKSWLIDNILDVARQKGTGMWTTQSAMELQIPVPTIDLAVAMRDLTVFKEFRKDIAGRIKYVPTSNDIPKEQFLKYLEDGLFCSILLSYTQGFALLKAASAKYGYNMDLQTIAKIWRGGCIIRSAVLEDIQKAFSNKELPFLLLNPAFSKIISDNQDGLRKVVNMASSAGIAAPAMMASLGFLDAFRSERLPANLIQAQRDFFGSHTYERSDREGTFHTQWD